MTTPPGRILVVDDEASIREILSRGLARDGFSVETAAQAEPALLLLRADPGFDAIILDNNMPGMMGVQALPLIAKLTPAPVLMITGHPTEDLERDARLLGAKGLMVKPLDLRALTEAVLALAADGRAA